MKKQLFSNQKFLLGISWQIISICLTVILCSFVTLSVSYSEEINPELVKTAAQSFISLNFKGYELDTTAVLISEKGQYIGNVVNLKPEGYIILSNRTELSPIIAYSKKGNFNFKESTGNILLHLVKWDLESRIKNVERKFLQKQLIGNNELWESLITTGDLNYSISLGEVYGPLLTTNWYQSGFYNDFCPVDPEGNRSVVGCVATATGQIMNYWQFPTHIVFDIDNDSYVSKGKNGNISIPNDASQSDFPSFSELNSSLSSIQYNFSETELGYFCFGIGIKHKMNYSSSGSGAGQSDDVYRDLGFGSANYGRWDNCYDNIINNIINGWPVQVSIHNYTSDHHHSVVFDGYNSSDNSFHVNMGWSGTSEDTWYIPPSLDTQYEFNSMGWAVYDICPYPGWAQYAADEKNTRRTIYSIPLKNEKKWHITCDASYRFDGLVVGKSSMIISSINPLLLNDVYHPAIQFINENGVKTSEIVISEEVNGISHPAQNLDADVYVTTQEGKIYLINQDSLSVKKIFQNASGEEFVGDIKIDSDNNLYVSTWYKFYCLNENGQVNWCIDAPNDCWFVRGTPAIDASNNKVYTSYWNTIDKKSFFLTIDRISGTVLNSKEFSDIPYSSRHLGIPSIAQDGKVYFGKRTKLYELDPNNNFSLNEIFDNEWSTITESPAIGNDGSIYISHWISETQQVISALYPDGNKKWEIPFTLTDYDNIREIYVDNHSDVCFTIQRENGSEDDTYTLYAYHDNGSSYTKLWERYFNTDGGYTAFGPNNTVFVSNNNKITAISESPEGESFPEYTNNNPPDIPLYSAPEDGASDLDTSLSFSWSCSDPDGHSLKYTFYLGGSSDMIGVYASDITNNSIQISGLKPDSSYLWSVAATDGQSTTQGPVWSLITKPSDSQYSVIWEDNFDTDDGWYDKLYQGNGSFSSGIFDGENVCIFNMSGSPGVFYTYKQLTKSIPIGSILKAKWYYESSGLYDNSENSDGGSVLFLNSVPTEQSNLPNETIQSLFAARDYPMYQWNVEEFEITQNIPLGSYIAIGGAVWPSYIINNWDYINIYSTVTSISADLNLPKEYILYQNYPNPFNSMATIRYYIRKASNVTMAIYNLNGQVIETLVNQKQEPGFYTISWDAYFLPSGVYFYKIQAGDFTQTKKCLLIK